MDVIAFDGYNIESSKEAFKTITAGRNDTHNLPVVCLNDYGGKMDEVMAFNWANSQSMDMPVSDKATALRAAPNGYPAIACYALKGNFIDRETQQNGIGWHEGVEFTLDATDRHGVCYEISRSMLNGGMNAGGMPVEENLQPTITAQGASACAYPKITGALCAAGY